MWETERSALLCDDATITKEDDMGEILIPKEADTSEPLSQRWGLSCHYALSLPIATSISEGGGLGHSFGFALAVAESFTDSYTLGPEFTFGKTEGKLFPSTFAPGTTTETSHLGIQFGFGHTSRKYPYFNDSGDYVANLSIGQTPLIGGGKTTVSPSELGEVSATTWDIGTAYSAMGEFRPWGRGPTLSVGPALYYGVQYEDEDSEFNRVKLSLMLALQIGYGDASVRAGTDADMELGPMGIAQGFYSLFHGWAARFAMDKVLSEPQDALSKYGLPTSSTGDRGSQANLPALEAAAAFLGGTGSSATVALRSPPWGYWTFLAAQTLGGGLFLGLGSDASKGAGLADLLGVVRPGLFKIADIESPSARRSKDDDTIERREVYVNLASFALNTAVMLLGGAAAGSDIAMSGGASANLQVAMNPDPIERRMVERTDYVWVPITCQGGSKNGSRAGISIHKSWHDWPWPSLQLFSSTTFLSPSLTIKNMANSSQDEPYDDIGLNSDVDAAIGLEWKTTYTRLSLGLDTKAVFGSDTAKAGIGAILGFDFLLPFNGKEDGSGISAGVRGMCHKLFPDGYQCEVFPQVGATLHF